MGKHTSNGSLSADANANANANAATKAFFNAVDSFQGRELVDRLRELGLDKYVELPQIAVMGDTSSGKSSLLSALSGVSFPSSHALTTRCPTQLILSRAPTFAGSVRLHRHHANTSEHHAPIASMDDVPNAIEKLTQMLVDEGQHISDDAIIIELRGPQLPNLTLTDLPGIIRATSDKDDKSVIPRVRALVNRYMTQSRTVIMAVVPANVDVHNVEVLQDAVEADKDGLRTIAVVTKLDLVDKGAEAGVDQLIRNQTKRLALGYHAVKCRGQKDLDDGVDVALGRQQEKQFFHEHPVWHALPNKLWGVDELTHKLVDVMQNNIRRTLPEVIKEINKLMGETTSELEALGVALDSPVARRQKFCQWADQFVAHMQAVLKGDYGALADSPVGDTEDVDLRLRAQIRVYEQAFQNKIKATAECMPGSSDSDVDELQPGDYVLVDVTGTEKSFRVDKVKASGDVLCLGFSADEWLGTSRYEPHHLNHLRRYIVKNRGDELLIFPPYTVFSSILRQWVDTWEAPMLELVQQYRKLTLGVAMRFAKDLNATPRVQQYVEERAKETIDTLRSEAEAVLRAELARERRPYTQNAELTQTYTQLLRPGLETLLQQNLTMHSGNRVDFAQLLDVLTNVSHTSDEHDTVLMDCGLRAYFQVAMKRFVDVVPMQLNERLLHQFVKTMRAELQDKTTDDRLAKLLSESEATRARRRELEEKLKTLRRAKHEIEELM